MTVDISLRTDMIMYPTYQKISKNNGYIRGLADNKQLNGWQVDSKLNW